MSQRDAMVVTSWVGETTVLEAGGSAPDAAAMVNAALLRALHRNPRSVVCDLSRVDGDLDERMLERLLDTGGYLENWPGTRLVLVHPDRRRPDLAGVTTAGSTIVMSTLADALQVLSVGPAPRTAELRVEPHPRASRSARDFVSRTCLDWQRPHVIGSAVLVVSELVTNGLNHAGTNMDITLSTFGDRVRLAVHDGADEPPRVLPAGDRHGRGRGMHVVEGFSRAWGSLPGPQGGKAVWVVLDA